MTGRPPRLLAHEIFFGLFIAAMAVRLSFTAGPLHPHALFYWLLLLVEGRLVLEAERRKSSVWWRARLLFFPVAMNLTYLEMRTGVPLIVTWRADEWLQRIDRAIVGTNLSLLIEPWTRPAATELLSFCYFLYIPYLYFIMVRYFIGDLGMLKRFYAGLFTVYGIGFLGYSLVPAAGPYIAMADRFTLGFGNGWMTAINARMVFEGSNRVDVFPSLHCAVSAFILFFDRVHAPRRFRLFVVPCAGLWISTIYLRYHYFVDVVAGFALAGLALAISRKTGENLAPDRIRASF